MISKLIEKLKSSKKRRELFVAGQIKTGIPFQVRALRDKMGWTQAQLGAQLGMTQTNVSRLESPGYGRLNITTLQRIASVFDVALIVRFVSFSELARWVQNLSPDVMAPKSFDEESDENFIMPTRYQGSFAQATYLAPSSSFAIDITGRSESFYRELRQKMGLSSIDEEASGTLRSLISGLGNVKSYTFGQVSKGNILELDYSHSTFNEGSDSMPMIDYTGEADELSTQPTATGLYHFIPAHFRTGTHVN